MGQRGHQKEAIKRDRHKAMNDTHLIRRAAIAQQSVDLGLDAHLQADPIWDGEGRYLWGGDGVVVSTCMH